MRVIAGRLRGRTIESGTSEGLRPTADRTRETLFNMIASRLEIEGASTLDLYAGTGALGIEALSRGAGHCTFVERENAALKMIRRNVATLELNDRATIVGADALRWLESAEAHFHLILADPPYALARRLPELLRLVSERSLLAPSGLLVLECAEAVAAPINPAFEIVADRVSGAARVVLYRGAGSGLQVPAEEE